MSSQKNWLPLVGALAVLGLAAMLFVLLLNQEDAPSGTSRGSLSSAGEEQTLASGTQEREPAVQRDRTKVETRRLEELPGEDEEGFKNRIRGFVTSPNGSDRIAGAKVVLKEVPLPFAFAALAGGAKKTADGILSQAETDELGNFSFFDVPKKDVRYQILAYHQDYAPALQELPGIPASGDTAEYELRMNDGFRLYGRVLVKGDESPIVGARVIVRKSSNMSVFLGATSSEPGEFDLVQQTDSGGYYEIKNAPVGGVEVLVQAEGYAEIRSSDLLDKVAMPELSKERDFHLGAGGEIAGRVELADGTPVPEARIVAIRTENNQVSTITGSADGEGKFTLAGLMKEESYFVRGELDGFISEGQAKAKAGDDEVVVTMARTGRIVGRAVRASNGRPLRRFTATVVSYRKVPQTSNNRPMNNVTSADKVGATGGQGDSTGGNLGFGTVAQAAGERGGEGSKRSKQAAAWYGGSPEIYTALGQTRRTIESRDGSFELDGVVASGKYVVLIQASALAPSVSEPFQCEKGLTVNVGDVQIGAGGAVEGTVTDAQGVPVANAYVAVNCAGADPSQNPINKILGPVGPQPLQRKSVKTDAEGRYRVDTLIPTPAANLFVTRKGFADGSQMEVAILAGQVTKVPPIVLNRGGRVFGSVLQDGIAPMSGMKVSLRPGPESEMGGSGSFFSREELTGHDGRFEFTGIPAGSYKIHTVPGTTDGVNPFSIILQIRKTEQTVEVLEGSDHEVTLNVPTAEPMPGIQPTFNNPSARNPRALGNRGGTRQPSKTLTEEEKLKLQRAADAGSAAAGSADAGGGGE